MNAQGLTPPEAAAIDASRRTDLISAAVKVIEIHAGGSRSPITNEVFKSASEYLIRQFEGLGDNPIPS